MYEDDVLKELWRIKDEIAAEHGYDVHALAQSLREEEGKDGRKLVSLSPKRPTASKRG
jgi:hypothetical protein